MDICTISSKGQITIPKKVRDALNLKAGDKVVIQKEENGRFYFDNTIRYAQDKTKGGIDLDLFFPRLQMYGDLKAHSSTSNGIQGNDWQTIFRLINEPSKQNHIYYIVCEHDTEKDMDHSFEVGFLCSTRTLRIGQRPF